MSSLFYQSTPREISLKCIFIHRYCTADMINSKMLLPPGIELMCVCFENHCLIHASQRSLCNKREHRYSLADLMKSRLLLPLGFELTSHCFIITCSLIGLIWIVIRGLPQISNGNETRCRTMPMLIRTSLNTRPCWAMDKVTHRHGSAMGSHNSNFDYSNLKFKF